MNPLCPESASVEVRGNSQQLFHAAPVSPAARSAAPGAGTGWNTWIIAVSLDPGLVSHVPVGMFLWSCSVCCAGLSLQCLLCWAVPARTGNGATEWPGLEKTSQITHEYKPSTARGVLGTGVSSKRVPSFCCMRSTKPQENQNRFYLLNIQTQIK